MFIYTENEPKTFRRPGTAQRNLLRSHLLYLDRAKREGKMWAVPIKSYHTPCKYLQRSFVRSFIIVGRHPAYSGSLRPHSGPMRMLRKRRVICRCVLVYA